MTWAFGQPIGDAAAKLVLLVLANRADHKTRECWPRVDTIAEEASQSPRSVLRKIQWLEAAGLIEKNKTKDDSGRQVANRYIVRLDRTYDPNQSSDDEQPGDNLAPGPKEQPGDSLACGPSDTLSPTRVTLLSPGIEEPTEEPRTPIAPKGAVGDSKGEGKDEDPAFAAFLAAWPPSRTFSRHTAERQWRRLDEAERPRATAAVKPYLDDCRAQQRRPVDPSSFLSRRLFDNFDAAPISRPVIDPRHVELRRLLAGRVDDTWVWVECGTAEFNAWLRACQAAGIVCGNHPPPIFARAPGRVRGRLFPSPLPPDGAQIINRSEAA